LVGGITFSTRGGRVAELFAVGAATLALAACSSGNTSSPATSTSVPVAPTSTSGPPSTTVSPAEKAKADAVAAYEGMWQNFVAASGTSDWQSPKLGQYTTGVALTNLSRGLYTDHYNGLVTKGQPTHSVQVSSAGHFKPSHNHSRCQSKSPIHRSSLDEEPRHRLTSVICPCRCLRKPPYASTPRQRPGDPHTTAVRPPRSGSVPDTRRRHAVLLAPVDDRPSRVKSGLRTGETAKHQTADAEKYSPLPPGWVNQLEHFW
jgi:hypothetical protein